MKKWLRYTVLILLLWLLFVILCLVVPPLFHKEAGYGPGADAEGDSFSTPERILCIDDNKEALIWRLRLLKNGSFSLPLISEMRKADRISWRLCGRQKYRQPVFGIL